MKKPVPPAHLWEILEAEHQKNIAPADSFTIKQYCERFGLCRDEGRSSIDKLERNGLVEFVGNYGFRAQKHYCLKAKRKTL
jgi:DNA-binding GntR family transcriptional regulator